MKFFVWCCLQLVAWITKLYEFWCRIRWLCYDLVCTQTVNSLCNRTAILSSSSFEIRTFQILKSIHTVYCTTTVNSGVYVMRFSIFQLILEFYQISISLWQTLRWVEWNHLIDLLTRWINFLTDYNQIYICTVYTVHCTHQSSDMFAMCKVSRTRLYDTVHSAQTTNDLNSDEYSSLHMQCNVFLYTVLYTVTVLQCSIHTHTISYTLSLR